MKLKEFKQINLKGGDRKIMKTKIKQERGITLIALVITIVVLLILAGVSINAIFGDSGIIEKAKDAQNKMDQATQNDLDAIDGLNNLINSKTNGTTGGNTGKDDDKPFGGEKYNKAEKNNDGTLKANTEYTDSENTTVTIPKGFKVSNVAATESTEGEQTVSTGLVIQDAEGNEFVWVPVNYTATGTLDSDGLDSGFKEVFKRSEDSSSYEEPFANGYEGEDTEYIKMMKSVQSNKGFYIGRYEAGTTDPRTRSTTDSSKIVVKRDAYPYIQVGWGNKMNNITEDVKTDMVSGLQRLIGKGAVYLSKHMYDSKDIGATSTLCYGVQWDAIMKFVEDSTHSTTNSTNWGNYNDASFTINRGKYAKYGSLSTWYDYNTALENCVTYANGTSTKVKGDNSSSTSILLTTGASDSLKAKNIFDLAGNVEEWTMEAFYYRLPTRVYRGGNYIDSRSNGPASERRYGDTPSISYYGGDTVGFRPALYL